MKTFYIHENVSLLIQRVNGAVVEASVFCLKRILSRQKSLRRKFVGRGYPVIYTTTASRKQEFRNLYRPRKRITKTFPQLCNSTQGRWAGVDVLTIISVVLNFSSITL